MEAGLGVLWVRSRVTTTEPVVVTDPAIMSGAPVFQGTRVPIVHVLASLRAGFDLEQLRDAYPFLTAEHVRAATAYVLDLRPCAARKPATASSKRILVSREWVDLPPRLGNSGVR